jgi:hypothetical protein
MQSSRKDNEKTEMSYIMEGDDMTIKEFDQGEDSDEEFYRTEGENSYFLGLPFANLKITFKILPQEYGIYPVEHIEDNEIVLSNYDPIDVLKFDEEFLNIFLEQDL